MAKPQRVVFADLEDLSREAARRFVMSASRAIEKRERFLVVLSGGRTSKRAYQLLTEPPFCDEVAWKHVHIFLSDERYVPVSDPESNFGQIQEILVRKVKIPKANLHPFRVGAPSLAAAAKATNEHLHRFFGLTRRRRPRFDLIFLGMGTDGHAAGLFPGTEASREKREFVTFSEKTGGFNRLSLSPPFLNAALEVIFLVSGLEKARMVSRILEGNGKDLPAAAVKPKAGHLLWFMDKAAASLLKSPT